jgi:hypothetical protein
VTTETSYEQTNMKIQTFIYDLNSFLAVCYLGTLNSKTRRPTEIICSTKLIGSYVKTMSAEGGHLGWRSGSPDTILKIDLLRTIHAMFALNWLTGFRGKQI